MLSKYLFVSIWGSDSTYKLSVLVRETNVCVKATFSCISGSFLYRCYLFQMTLRFVLSNMILQKFHIFIEAMINGSRASLFGVLLLLIFICLIALPACSGHALLAGIVYVILAPVFQ